MRAATTRIAILLVMMTSPAAAQSTIRFGVLGLFHPRELELSTAGTEALRIEGLPQPLVLNGEGGKLRLIMRASSDRILVSGAPAAQVRITGRDGSPVRFQLAVPGKLRRAYEGKLTVAVRRGELVAMVSMDREMAVATIVASEMPADAPREALKAQAVATRSFLAAGPRHAAFDFCDTTHCQYLRSPDEITPRVRAAVEATRGQILSWRGLILPALYASRCGGQTRALRNLGVDPGGAYPYYSVSCAWCRRNPLRGQTNLPAGIQASDSGNENSLLPLAHQWGWGALPGESPVAARNPDGTRIADHNLGHGLGMCQLGAIGMALDGADYRSILAHYYPNTELTGSSPPGN